MQNNDLDEVRLKTGTPGVTIVQRAKDGGLETLRETRQSTGEVADENDASQTIETITITRKTLSNS